MRNNRRIQVGILLAGDLAVILLVTLFGFASHGTLGTAGARMLSTFFPLLAGWFAVAPFLLAYDPKMAATPVQLWRPFWAMVIAAPLAAFLRGVWLNTAILPLFVFILGGISSLAILIWRGIYVAALNWRRRANG